MATAIAVSLLENFETASVSSHSSSGLSDGDVALIGHPDDSSHLHEIEKHLQASGYTLVQGHLIAGPRTKFSNMMSSIKHASYSVLVMTDDTTSKLKCYINALLCPKGLLGNITIITYQSSKSKPGPREFRGDLLLKVSNDPADAAEKIIMGIEAFRETENEGIKDQIEKRKLATTILICSIINPDGEKRRSISPKTAQEVQDGFERRFGNFKEQKLKKWQEFIRGNQGITWDTEKKVLTLSSKGALTYLSWLGRMQRRNEMEKNKTAGQNEIQNWLESQPTDDHGDETDKGAQLKILNEFQFADDDSVFFLISTKLTSSDTLQGFANIPWLRVFDFDDGSDKTGLLNALNPLVSKSRNLSSCSLGEEMRELHATTTDWVFLNISANEDFRSWLSKNCAYLDLLMESTANHCCPQKKPFFLLLCYDLEPASCHYLDCLLTAITKNFSYAGNFPMLICGPNVSEPRSHDVVTDRPLQAFLDKYKLTDSYITITLESLSRCLAQITQREDKNRLILAKKSEIGDDFTTVAVPKSDRLWINPYVDIIPTELVATDVVIEERKLDGKEGSSVEEFLHGGVVSWLVLNDQSVAIMRDITHDVRNFLHGKMEGWETVVVTLSHTPGSGGTTLARQLLWEFRLEATCVVIKVPVQSTSELLTRMEHLYRLTKMPILALLDGGNASDLVTRARKSLAIKLVILNVQREYENVQIENEVLKTKGFCRLSTFLSNTEAHQLSDILSDLVSDKRSELAALAGEESVQMFEFGLTAFKDEYFGIKQYIIGYMDPKLLHLINWQKVVAYLALLLYYGQTGIYKNVFQLLLNPSARSSVQLTDLPYKGQQFIIENEYGVWKIRYHIVAKEILEFVLSNPSAYSNIKIGNNLSKSSQKGLHQLVVDFINEIKEVIGNTSPSDITGPLFDMILKRDTKQNSKERQPPMLSRLLNDVALEKDRISVVVALTKAFPKHVDFHAHLGRLYSISRKFDKAEEALRTAINLASGRQKYRGLSELGRIHNMFGFSYLKHVNHLLSRKNTKPNMTDVLEFVVKAVKHFQAERNLVNNNVWYSYIGEIKSRLRIAEYAHASLGGCMTAFDGSIEAQLPDVAKFVRDSYSMCYRLLRECKQYSSDKQLHQTEYSSLQESYNMYFGHSKVSSFNLKDTRLNIPMARAELTNLKNHDRMSINNIQHIVNLHERLLHDIFSHQLKVNVSFDMCEWLTYIRKPSINESNYPITKVLPLVLDWSQRNEYGFANVYLYALTLVQYLHDTSQTITYDRLSAIEVLRKKLRERVCSFHDRTLEFLVNNHSQFPTIGMLMPSRQLGQWNSQTQTWKNKLQVERLKVCTGTVQQSQYPARGLISLDMNLFRDQRVNVHFHPERYGLHGKFFSDRSTRVEFYLGFHTYNGAEAHSVRPLQQQLCNSCKKNTEILTLNHFVKKCLHCGQALKS